jgi:hypothetical protein
MMGLFGVAFMSASIRGLVLVLYTDKAWNTSHNVNYTSGAYLEHVRDTWARESPLKARRAL